MPAGKPMYLGREIYKTRRLRSILGFIIEVDARVIDIGWLGWFAGTERRGIEITWLKGLYVEESLGSDLNR